jgi:hypothetical protein
VAEAATAVGNATRELDVTRFGAVFLGIVFGIALGSVPIAPRPARARSGWGWRRGRSSRRSGSPPSDVSGESSSTCRRTPT